FSSIKREFLLPVVFKRSKAHRARRTQKDSLAGAAAGQAWTYSQLYTPAALRQGFAQDLDTAFTDFSPKQRGHVGGQRAFHRDGDKAQRRLKTKAVRHGPSRRAEKALPAAVKGLPADPVPAAAVEVVPGQGAADGGKVHPDLMGPPGDRDAGGQAQAVPHLEDGVFGPAGLAVRGDAPPD